MTNFTRKDAPGSCPSCHKGGYSVQPSRGDGRPLFACGHCGWTWTCGNMGGKYLSESGRAKFTGGFADTAFFVKKRTVLTFNRNQFIEPKR